MLKKKLTEIKKEERRNQYQTSDLDDKVDKLDTIVKKKKLFFEGVPEIGPGEKENTQWLIYDVFYQMNINHSVEYDTCYRTGP